MSKRSLTESELHPKVVLRLQAWGKAISKRRRQMKLSQAQLGYRVGVTNQTIGRIEAGDPTVRAASYFAALLVVDLLGDLVPMPAENLLDLSSEAQRIRRAKQEDNDYF
ncbi:helix-turn-helix transcriptional regulator [Chitinimonas arctica]|uniref:Helix-turn-helix transcriptional regulator n=1 Tax=Chitinimonas arctica TaxID=2594795 RepID=A0A516SFT1_9NEIS|nr:helix-turn-helix transcriptional regulator [Chitinimonas arctica]QDQ27019.1 helix-turn-helix transcriptional regulator [Chitinimonas arctica]